MVGVSLKDLAKPSKINGLQAASKMLLSIKSCNRTDYPRQQMICQPLQDFQIGF